MYVILLSFNCFLDIRQKETSVLGDSAILQSLNVSLTNAVSTFSTAITFIVHIYTGNDLLASQVRIRHVRCHSI